MKTYRDTGIQNMHNSFSSELCRYVILWSFQAVKSGLNLETFATRNIRDDSDDDHDADDNDDDDDDDDDAAADDDDGDDDADADDDDDDDGDDDDD